jgi:glycine oxidase
VLGAEPPDAEAERLAGTDLARVAPGLAARAAWWLPSECALDTRRVVTAVRTAAESAGASFVTGQAVAAIEDRVRTEHGAIEGTPIVCAGAWSATLAGLDAVPVRPVRGQLVALRATLDRVVFDGLHYLVPRDDEVVAGTTVEEVGFERGTREEDIRGILAAAGALLPRLRGAQMLRAWSSFRPGTPDRQPIVGRLGPAWIASGHYRNGVLLAPLTAELLCRGILDGAPLPARWNPGRFRREISPA